MKIDIDNLNPGSWFFFFDDKPEEGRIKLRVLNTEMRSKIADKTTEIKIEYRTSQRYEVEKVNTELASKMMWDFIIVDWENLLNNDGSPIECNIDNKYLLMTNEPGFAAFIAECLEKLNEDIFERKAFSEKN
jgi:hypothetical protein